MNGVCYKCAWCGNPILSPNRCRKYCTDECAKLATRAKNRERAKRRYHANIEAERARSRQYYAAHAEQEKANFTEWRKANRERYNAYCREYYYRKKE